MSKRENKSRRGAANTMTAKSLPSLVTVACLVVLMPVLSTGDPAPPFGSTVADASSYDVTVTLLPDNEYQWLVDYNDSVLPTPNT